MPQNCGECLDLGTAMWLKFVVNVKAFGILCASKLW